MSVHSLHLGCRLFQGFIGAFLFFYAFLLAQAAFENQQQHFALTMTTVSLNVAEVFGPFFGAWLFANWGLSYCYYVLFSMSLVNNVLLVAVYFMLPTDDPERQALLSKQSDVSLSHDESNLSARSTYEERFDRLQEVLQNRLLWRSLVVIAPAAMVKASFESILPLFGDNHGYDEFEVGQLFTLIALGFIFAAVLLGMPYYNLWDNLSDRGRAVLVSMSLFMLGFVACVVLYSWGVSRSIVLRDWIEYL